MRKRIIHSILSFFTNSELTEHLEMRKKKFNKETSEK